MNKMKINALTKQDAQLEKEERAALTDYLLARDKWRGIQWKRGQIRRDIKAAERE